MKNHIAISVILLAFVCGCASPEYKTKDAFAICPRDGTTARANRYHIGSASWWKPFGGWYAWYYDCPKCGDSWRP